MDTKETLKHQLIEKLGGLGEQRLREIMDYVDRLAMKETQSDDLVLQVAGCLSGKSLSAVEIENELYGNDHT